MKVPELHMGTQLYGSMILFQLRGDLQDIKKYLTVCNLCNWNIAIK
jgi:hypothetical protein